MSILYEEQSRTITLHTVNTTYQMQIDRYGFLLHLYYGKRADGCMDYLLTYYDRGFSGNPYEAGTDKTYSMDSLPQEFPSLGTGDYRTPACIIKIQTGRTAVISVMSATGSGKGSIRFPGFLRCTRRRMRLRVWRSCCVIR